MPPNNISPHPHSHWQRCCWEFFKWRETALVSISNVLAYKANFVLMMIGPVIIFFLIQYNLWSSIYQLRRTAEIGGYSLSDMITYQGWVLVVSLLAQGYTSRNLAEDIRLGRISTYLIYPFDFWQYHLASFIGFQIIQVSIATLSICLLILFGVFSDPSLAEIASGVFISLLAGALWYLIQYTLGLLAFWLEETWTLRVIVLIIASFCSGAIIPLELFPGWARVLALYSPFPYLTYVPVRIFMGAELTLPLPPTVALLFWIFIVWGISRYTWNRGIKLYSAAGM